MKHSARLTQTWGKCCASWPRTENVVKRNSRPLVLLSSCLVVLSFCGDVFSTGMWLQNPISFFQTYKKNEYNDGHTDVCLCGPERSTGWMSQKSQKTQFCAELGIVWHLSEKGKTQKPTLSFTPVEHNTYLLEKVGNMKLGIKYSALFTIAKYPNALTFWYWRWNNTQSLFSLIVVLKSNLTKQKTRECAHWCGDVDRGGL